ncbi:MAG: hypothetical protein KDK44_05655 [Chlamydiia bacterium]|nr:hypothetical protein [Chlamydiia bacterium]
MQFQVTYVDTRSLAVKRYVVDFELEDRADKIRDHFLQGLSIKSPLKLEIRKDLERGGWVEIEGNKPILSEGYSSYSAVELKVTRLFHNIHKCSCHPCNYAKRKQGEKSIGGNICEVMENTLPTVGLVSFVMLLLIGTLAANTYMVKSPPFCDDEEKCWSQMAFFGGEAAVGLIASVVFCCWCCLRSD